MTALVSGLFGGMGNLITLAQALATVSLIVLLVVREFVTVADGPQAPERKNLNLVIQGLLIAFGAVIVLRLFH